MHFHSRMLNGAPVTAMYNSVLDCTQCTPVIYKPVVRRQPTAPYRMVVFASDIQVKAKKRRFDQRYTPITFEKRDYAYMGWNPDHTLERGRLPGSGCFIWPGLHAVRKAAMAELAKPEVQSVSIRTNQDRNVHRFVKQHDGRITGYGQLDE